MLNFFSCSHLNRSGCFATGLSVWRPGADPSADHVRCIAKWHWARFVHTSFSHCRCYSL